MINVRSSTSDTNGLDIIFFFKRSYLMPAWSVQLVLFGNRMFDFPSLIHYFTSCQLLVIFFTCFQLLVK